MLAMDPTIERILLLFAGWALGLLSPLIVDAAKRRRENREVKSALQVELAELEYRLAVSVFMIETRFGRADRELLNWLRPIIVRYRGLNPTETLLKTIDSLLSLSDESLMTYAATQKAPPDGALGLKKYTVPLLESKFALLSALDVPLQNRLLEIRAHLGLFNEEVDQARYYFQLTFNSSVSEENRNRVEQNLIGCYKNASARARITVDHIGQIGWR
jgi:hypothetical protein